MLFIEGLINNSVYVLIGAGAQDLAEAFEKDNLMSAFQMYVSDKLVV